MSSPINTASRFQAPSALGSDFLTAICGDASLLDAKSIYPRAHLHQPDPTPRLQGGWRGSREVVDWEPEGATLAGRIVRRRLMSENDIDSMLNSYLRDAHAMERNVLQMLNSMIQTTTDEEITGILQHHKDETEQQIQRLESSLEARGTDTSTLKDAGAVTGAIFKGMADAVRSDKAGKNARDGYVTEALEIASYQLLERLANQAGDSQAAEVARTNRSEEEAMRDKIDANWDRFISLLLQEEEVSV